MEVAERFGDLKWRALDHGQLFANLENILKTIPPEEHYDLHYSVHHVFEQRGRVFQKATVVPFDIDKIAGYQESMAETVARLFVSFFGLHYEKTAVVSSGNGVHLIVALNADQHISDLRQHSENYIHYKRACERFQEHLHNNGFAGCIVDPHVYTKAATMRLPGTKNVLGKEKPTECRLIQRVLLPQNFDITKFSGVQELPEIHAVSNEQLKKFPPIDTDAMLGGCAFLRHCKEQPSSVTEPEWFAMLSLVGRAHKDSNESARLAHEYSKGHPKYTPEETDKKLQHALEGGPRTCRGVDNVWVNSKCRQCPHWSKIASPVLIRGERYIETEDCGFWFYRWNEKSGKTVPEKPDYEGLKAFFERDNTYISTGDSNTTFVWRKNVWEEWTETEIKNYAYEKFDPFASGGHRNEFYNLIAQTNLKRHDWFSVSTIRKMNFLNGVLDVDTLIVEPHTTNYGFRTVLPYEYDPKATAPNFDKFLDEVTLGRNELKQVLLEFAGYSLSGDECWEQKAMLLVGEGQNGKSKFVQILRALAGKDSVSALTLTDLDKETHRYLLEKSLFNVAEETPRTGFLDSSIFKNLVGGGEVSVKQLYKQPYNIRNKSKFWFLCNELPKTYDLSHGMFRRLVIVPFDARFSGEKEDKKIEEKLLPELPGILNMCMAAYARMRARGSLYRSEIVAAKLQEYKEDVDIVRRWVKDNLEVLPEINGKYTPCKKIYGQYSLDMDAENERPLTSAMFFKRLTKILPEYDARRDRVKVDGNIQRVLRGVLLHDGSVF